MKYYNVSNLLIGWNNLLKSAMSLTHGSLCFNFYITAFSCIVEWKLDVYAVWVTTIYFVMKIYHNYKLLTKHQKIKFIPMKIHKTVVTRAAPFGPDMHQIVCRLGLRPRPHWGSLQRSPRPPSWIKGAYFYGKGSGRGREGWGEGRGRGGEGRRGRGGDGREGEGTGKGE